MDGTIGISSDSESQKSNEFVANREVEQKVDSPQESLSDTLKKSDTNKEEDNIQKTEDVASSGDEYISDSCSEDTDQKQEETKPKEQPVKILPNPEVKNKVFYLNGMKITVHKRPQRKHSHRDL